MRRRTFILQALAAPHSAQHIQSEIVLRRVKVGGSVQFLPIQPLSEQRHAELLGLAESACRAELDLVLRDRCAKQIPPVRRFAHQRGRVELEGLFRLAGVDGNAANVKRRGLVVDWGNVHARLLGLSALLQKG